MAVKFSNNAYTSLASTITAGATSFSVASAATFPTLGAGDWTYVSLTDEVVKVTAISGTTFTCDAVSGGHSAGINIELRMTAELLNDFAEDTEALPLAGGALTGAVTTTSTFDGRDVSTDGAKLDGIAASANNYTHPANHAISVITGLQTALDGKVDDSQVLTNVPSGAVFTDTETTTTLSLATNILSYVDEAGVTTNLDLSLYLDDTNLAYIASGALNGSTGIATFTRSDASTFTVDLSALLDDTVYTHPTGAGNLHLPTGGTVNQLLTNTASGTGTWQDAPVSLPSQATHAGKYLVTDGTSASWEGQQDTSVEYTATASQTSFAVTYTVGFVTVFLNGVKLPAADYTATNGTTVVLDVGATAGDEVYIQAFGSFVLADTYTVGAMDTLLDAKEAADATILKDADIGVTVLSPTGDGSGLSGINTDLVSDTTPQLGGDLDANGNNIIGIGTLKGVSYTAVDGDNIIVTAGSITITLPATPTAGDTVTVKDGTGAAATTTWTVARNGSNIASSATDLTFDKNWAEITMTYIDSTIGWSV